MDELKKNVFLLTFLAILLVAKFIYFPIINWQNSLYNEVTLLEKRVNKVKYILEQKNEIQSNNDKLTLSLSVTNDLFHPKQEQTKFQLQQQKKFEKILIKYKANITKFAWKKSTDLPAVTAKNYQFQVFFNAATLNIIKLMAHLEKSSPYIDIHNFSFTVKGQDKEGLGRAIGNMTINLYVTINDV